MKAHRRAVVVLGMHRSGTSVLARGLQALGVSIGDKLLGGNEWNPTGYFEHADIVRLNDVLLGLAGKRWDSLALPPPEVMEPLFEPYKAEALAVLERDFAATAICGIKDPRATRLLPFWQSAFAEAGMQDRYVIALRNPISVARSLAARNGFRPEKSYLLWLAHMFAAIRDTRGKARVVVDYDELIAGPAAQLERLAAALDIRVTKKTRNAIAEYADGFLSDSLRHSTHDPTTVRDDPRISELVGKAYDLLCQMARDELRTAAARRAFEHEWQALEQTLHDIAPVFQYLDDCEDQIDALALKPEASIPAPVQLKAATPAHAPGIPAEESKPRTVKSDLRVSVVIPLFNHEQYIEAAIESVLAQTVRPAEIIVIDDGSTDESAAKVRRLCERHSEIVFWSWPNQGAHHTLNAAIHRATGDFVAILNSDDCYEPDRLAACLAIVEADPTVDVVATGVSFMDDQGRHVETHNAWYENARTFFRNTGELSLALFHANFLLTTSNLFIRRTRFESVGYFSPLRYTHDLEFLLRLILANVGIHFLDCALLRYRWHDENTIANSHARVDVELSAIFAFFIYRQQLMHGADNGWKSWLERHVHQLGQKKLLETVEYFLALLESRQGSVVIAAPLAEEFRQLLGQLGADWVAPEIKDSRLTQFVAARNAFLLRWGYTSAASRVIAEYAESNAWLESQRLAWEQLAADRERLIADLDARLHEIEAANVWLESQRSAFQAGNVWLESQRSAWEKLAADREQVIADLDARLHEIEAANAWLESQRLAFQAGNAWLESQRLAWEQLAGERERIVTGLNARLHEFEAGNAWLESQRWAWEQLAGERERIVADLNARLHEFEASNAWLESQRSAWEQLAVERERSIAELNASLNAFKLSNAWLESQRLAWEQLASERERNINALVAERSLILNSLSWKLTRPLRYFRRNAVTRPLNFARRAYRQWHDGRMAKNVATADAATTQHLPTTGGILLVLHEFSRTGAPRATLYLARALLAIHGFHPVVIAAADGPIREEFEREGFKTVVNPLLFAPHDGASEVREFVSGFERVIVTPLASFPFVRHYGGIARHLTWWIHEEDKGFAYVAENFAPDLASIFEACDVVWLGSPLCFAPASKYAAKEKLHLLVYGCDDISIPHRKHQSGRVVFTIVGSIEPRKGQDIFLDAVEKLPEALRRKAIFRIIGSPYNDWSANYYQKISDRAQKIPEVECIPNMPFQQLCDLYSETDVVVSASRADPMPISITQGLMFSKVCLCSSAIGQAHLLADQTDSLIFVNESAEALSEKMAWIIQNPGKLSALGAAGRSVYEKHFLMSSFVANVSSLIHEDDHQY